MVFFSLFLYYGSPPCFKKMLIIYYYCSLNERSLKTGGTQCFFAIATGTTVLSKYKTVFKPAIVKGLRWAFVSQYKKTADTFPLWFINIPFRSPLGKQSDTLCTLRNCISSCCKPLQSKIFILKFPRTEKPVKVMNYFSALNRNYLHEAELF